MSFIPAVVIGLIVSTTLHVNPQCQQEAPTMNSTDAAAGAAGAATGFLAAGQIVSWGAAGLAAGGTAIAVPLVTSLAVGTAAVAGAAVAVNRASDGAAGEAVQNVGRNVGRGVRGAYRWVTRQPSTDQEAPEDC